MPRSNGKAASNNDLRARVLDSLSALSVRITGDELDAALSRAEREKLALLPFLEALLGDLAGRRRERCIARRIGEADFPERSTLETFDWSFNAAVFKREEIEQLATADFIRRRENFVFVGRSGIGKTHIAQAIGMRACALGMRVVYRTCANLLLDLNACIADKTVPQRVAWYGRHDLLIIDEFAFDRLERQDCPHAVNLLYKVIDARTRRRSTALLTNIDFEKWGDYLGDAAMAMALLDRLVDGAIVMKVKGGKSYREHRAKIAAARGAPAKSK